MSGQSTKLNTAFSTEQHKAARPQGSPTAESKAAVELQRKEFAELVAKISKKWDITESQARDRIVARHQAEYKELQAQVVHT